MSDPSHLPPSPPVTAPILAFRDRPVLLLFSDDSTLFFALRMRDILRAADPGLGIRMGWVVTENALSYRQMAQLLPEGPDLALRGKEFEGLMLSQQFRAILTSRVYRALSSQLRRVEIAAAAGRPCVISFLGGLDFFPEDGYFRRRHCDGVYLFPASNIAAYETAAKGWDRMWQEVGFGHPTFVTPHILPPETLAARQDIYFFTQALSPSSRRGRMHMLRALAAMARANPDRTVWIKLRHLPNENQKHLHLEKYDYPSLMEAMADLPSNLKTTVCTMQQALDQAALGLTCTSTAAIDVVRAGVPCMVHLDFVDSYVDDLVDPMRKLFSGSGLITSLEDMLHLRATPPDPDWVADMFCPRDLGERVLETVNRFAERPFQVPICPHLDPF
ncbi:DUF6716 putative glycosyltransferase [Parasedimentitalea huanghaiensis]|uniref:DUF6716 putative glycosyltransferase n=1 Tax=Parasedimentitalea huanghaiensis TaxID=2682100 RepID=UPI001ADB0148|nr:DUF6716 putative glycosyltransferase [Zongyanglinia huanghaiensis]